jgi:catalase
MKPIEPTAAVTAGGPTEPAKAERPPLSTVGVLARLVLIGILLAAVVAAFAYFGGWLTPHELTPARFVDALEQVDGVHAGFRRNHAKGIGVSGVFESNGNGVRLSKAAVFRKGNVPVIGRFSLGGGQPYAADQQGTVRGLGLQFSLPDGEEWRTAMVNLPVFPVSTPQAFYERLLATKPDPKTGQPDPAKMKAFLASHPEAERALAVIKAEPPTARFDNSTFYGLNAFRFIDAAGTSTPVRWILAPYKSFEAEMKESAPSEKNYLFQGLISRLARIPCQWRLIVVIGQPGDPTNDASVPWPATRERVEVGTLTLDRVESEETSPATDLNFDPLVLPAGIAPSDDPLLSARSAVYSQSFTRRAGEAKQRSAITPIDIPKGK